MSNWDIVKAMFFYMSVVKSKMTDDVIQKRIYKRNVKLSLRTFVRALLKYFSSNIDSSRR
jgi:hypothetical protein